MAAVAIISGAARAGDPLAAGLADAGFDLAVLGPSADACAAAVECARRSGRRALAVEVRAGEADSVQGAVDHVDVHLGPPSLLLHVVGAPPSGPPGGAVAGPVADWDGQVGGPLRETFLISRAVLDPMIREGCGRIVTVVDMPDAADGRENATVRAALEGFTRTLALEADAFGVTAHLVVVGRGVRAAGEILPPAPGPHAPGGRAPAAELAATVAFLAGDGAGIASGEVVHVAAAGGMP
ncbi:SDR family oxidoreductase [Embleya sp. NPDC056575]|uniref:SDR family oxidoreductase n=1 Tax=unclassified Embleya TaxID=2699296 RepID=UPI003693AA2B